MKKILNLTLTFSLLISSSATVIACGSGTQTTQAKQEVNKVNGKTINLQDTNSATYEGKTAQTDAVAIDNALISKYLTKEKVKDFTFNNDNSILKSGTNKVDFTVYNPGDKSIATGSLTVDITTYDWYKNMKLQNKDKFEVAYDGYYLNKPLKTLQSDWLNFGSSNVNKTIYFLLPGVTKTSDALKYIDLKDSAGLEKAFQYKYDDSKIQWNPY